MSDIRERAASDEAPVATSKKLDSGEIAAATEIDHKGDEVVGKTVTINRPRDELYRFWRDFRNLPGVLENVERIDVSDDRRSHWVVKAPGGGTVEWDALVTEDREGETIGWKSVEGADVPNSGRIDFADASGGRGTVVTATFVYDPPGGIIGKVVARLLEREPAIQARRDLRRFKQLMETGEISTNARNRAELENEKG